MESYVPYISRGCRKWWWWWPCQCVWD